MIRINLLPKELQSAAKAPFILFCTVVAGLCLTAVCIFIYAYLWFNVSVLEERVSRKQSEVQHLQSNAAEVDRLLDDIKDYKERERAIISIKTNRVLWSKKLSELAQLTPGFIWVISLEMKEFDPSTYKWDGDQEPSGGYLELTCYSSGDQVERMTLFRQRLKSADEFYMRFLNESIKPDNFYSDFRNISEPEFRIVRLPTYQEKNSIRFSVRLDLRPLADNPSQTPAT